MRRAQRVVIGLWAAFAFVIWNGVFDLHVRRGMHEYFVRQTLFERGQGPAAAIDAVMQPAIRRGARIATVWAAGVAALGLTALAWASDRNNGEWR